MTPRLETFADQSINHWEVKAPIAKRDLAIKKFAVTLIALINLTALGAVFYFIVSYCPISTQAMLASPFLVGVLGALVYLKFPTCGVNSMNYTQYSNPATMLGKVLTYVFFGPYMYITKKSDWNAYYDPTVANKIAHDLDRTVEKPMEVEKVLETYGRHFDNFGRYGIIPPDARDQLVDLYKRFQPVQKAVKYYEEKGLGWHERIGPFYNQKAEILLEVENVLSEIPMYYPPLPTYDFGKKVVVVKLKGKNLLNAAPFDE